MATVRFTKQYQEHEPGDVEQVDAAQCKWLIAHGYAVRTADKPKVRQAVIKTNQMELRHA